MMNDLNYFNVGPQWVTTVWGRGRDSGSGLAFVIDLERVGNDTWTVGTVGKKEMWRRSSPIH